MNDFEQLCRLGEGTFAEVYKALEKKTGEYVAIKTLKKKYLNWEECIELREAKSLKKLQEEKNSRLKGIDNIIRLKEMIFVKENGTLNLVFEYMDKDLYVLMKEFSEHHSKKRLSENQIRSIVYQILHGLCFMHKYGFFHRDLKPENILVGGEKVKIADFGLAREIRSIPPYTEYVSTRYYRAPECILKSTNYNSPVDIWALGCIMAEMYLHPQPLFFGNNEKEVLYRICSVLGTPTYSTWPEGIQQAKKCEIKFPTCQSTHLSQIIPTASKDAIDLINEMINWDPNKRATASSLINHPFFSNHLLNISLSSPDYSTLQVDHKPEGKFTTVKTHGNSITNKLTINTKNDFGIRGRREDDINFSKILNDTEVISKLKNDKYEDDLENNLFCSPVAGDKDFNFDSFKDSGPVMTQNTLFLGNSECFRESSSILNKNFTQLTNIEPGKNDNTVLLDDSNGNKFFNNSIINNINDGLTMTSLVKNNGDRILTNSSLEKMNNSSSNDKKEGDSKDPANDLDPIEKQVAHQHQTIDILQPTTQNVTKEKNTKIEETTTIDKNIKSFKHEQSNIGKRSPLKQIEDMNQKELNIITIPQKDTIPYPGGNNIVKGNNNNRFQHNNNQQIIQKPEFNSRRKKKNSVNENREKEEILKQIHLSKLLNNNINNHDMIIGNSNYSSNNCANNNNSLNMNNQNNKKTPNNQGFLFGFDSRRQHNIGNNTFKAGIIPSFATIAKKSPQYKNE